MRAAKGQTRSLIQGQNQPVIRMGIFLPAPFAIADENSMKLVWTELNTTSLSVDLNSARWLSERATGVPGALPVFFFGRGVSNQGCDHNQSQSLKQKGI